MRLLFFSTYEARLGTIYFYESEHYDAPAKASISLASSFTVFFEKLTSDE